MIKVKEDLTGQKFGALTVLYQTEDRTYKGTKRPEAQWHCKCDCGQEKDVTGCNLKQGVITSCGCHINRRKLYRQSNIYDLSGEYGICYAHNTDNPILFDLEDYDKIKDYCWSENDTGYARARDVKLGYNITMHRLLTNYEIELVDHINHNKLDNRKSNLRAVSKRENILNRPGVISTNTSGYTGVSWDKQHEQWMAQICVNNHTNHLGLFDSKTDAIKARLEAELKYFGPEFAPQRALFEEYGIEVEVKNE